MTIPVHVRCFGYNSPEVNKLDSREAGMAAKSLAESLAPPGAEVSFISMNSGEDKYNGRWLARVAIQDKWLDETMIAAGHGKPYFGVGPKA